MSEQKWFVYILECADETYYTGITNNISARIKKHNQGKGAKYTKGRIPVKLIWHECLENKSEALKKEASIKKLSRKQKEKLVCN